MGLRGFEWANRAGFVDVKTDSQRRNGRLLTMVAGTVATIIAGIAGAQTPTNAIAVRLELDNDFLAVHGAGPPADYDYTHGTTLGAAWPYAPSAIGRVLRAEARCDPTRARVGACVLSALSIAQQIYTPRHDSPQPVPGDRPYAAWLSAAGRIWRLSESTLQT